MLANYVKSARRHLWTNKLYTGLNAGGLAVGLTACLLMVLYMKHEFTYDSFHAKAHRIVRVMVNLTTPDAPILVASALPGRGNGRPVQAGVGNHSVWYRFAE